MGFGIRDPEKPYPGSRVKKAPDPGSGSATLALTKLPSRNAKLHKLSAHANFFANREVFCEQKYFPCDCL